MAERIIETAVAGILTQRDRDQAAFAEMLRGNLSHGDHLMTEIAARLRGDRGAPEADELILHLAAYGLATATLEAFGFELERSAGSRQDRKG